MNKKILLVVSFAAVLMLAMVTVSSAVTLDDIKACMDKTVVEGDECAPADLTGDGVINIYDITQKKSEPSDDHIDQPIGDPSANDIKACMDRTISGEGYECAFADLDGNGVVNIYDIIEEKEGASEVVKPVEPTEPEVVNDSSGSGSRSSGSRHTVKSTAPAGHGQVLGASTVNWDALSPEERAELINQLIQQLIKLFQGLIGNTN